MAMKVPQEWATTNGKPEKEHHGGSDDTEIPSNPGCLSELTAATHGSAGIDLAVRETVTIADTHAHIVPSICTGPLGFGLSALLLGRSPATRQGILVQPGVIDEDYKGPIGIMIRVLCPPVTIPKGSKMAQLVPFQ